MSSEFSISYEKIRNTTGYHRTGNGNYLRRQLTVEGGTAITQSSHPWLSFMSGVGNIFQLESKMTLGLCVALKRGPLSLT